MMPLMLVCQNIESIIFVIKAISLRKVNVFRVDVIALRYVEFGEEHVLCDHCFVETRNQFFPERTGSSILNISQP